MPCALPSLARNSQSPSTGSIRSFSSRTRKSMKSQSKGANMDPVIPTVAHRNAVILVRQRLAELAAQFEGLAELRERNGEAIGLVRQQRGAVAAERAAENFMSDAALARLLFEGLSGTELGKLLRDRKSVV